MRSDFSNVEQGQESFDGKEGFEIFLPNFRHCLTSFQKADIPLKSPTKLLHGDILLNLSIFIPIQ